MKISKKFYLLNRHAQALAHKHNMASITEIVLALGYTPNPKHAEVFDSPQGFPKTFMHEVPDTDKEPLADWFLARMNEIVGATLADKATSVKSTRAAQILFSIRAIAEEAADYPLSDDIELGIERAYLFFCQLLCKRPLGFNIPDFEQQVSHRPLIGGLKKLFADEFITSVQRSLNNASPAPTDMVWSVTVKAKTGQLVRGRRDGATHDTFNATVPLETQDHDVVISLIKAPVPKGAHPKDKTPSPKARTATPRSLQSAAGGGGGGSPKTREWVA